MSFSTIPIYKIKRLVGDKLHSVYVFHGSKSKTANIADFFTEEEQDEIQTDRAKVIFSEQTIYPDDTIFTIKIKLLRELKHSVSLEELYLFGQQRESLNSVAIYQALTQKAKLTLTRVRLDQFVQNVDELRDADIEDKDVYTYNDLFELKLDDKECLVDKPLGQKFFIVENEYPFVVNPFLATAYDKFLEQNARKTLSTLNNQLLLTSGTLKDNSMFLCLAGDVLSVADSKDLDEQTTLKLYYPLLFSKSVHSLEDLETQRPSLLQSNQKFDNERTTHAFKVIDMFYRVHSQRKNELKYVNKGVKFVRAVLKPDFNVKIPLEVIFKTVHANESNPLVKYNPSTRQENVYRLYADKLSTDGRKIPFLKKSSIFKLMKTIGRQKSVAIYIETTEQQLLSCEFDEEGYITLSAEFNDVMSLEDIDSLFQNLVNPVIQEVKSTLEQSGYKLRLFGSLRDTYVDIKQLTYETNVTISKAFDLDKVNGCIGSVFINETDRRKGDKVKLRFKRVSNFSKFTSQEAFVLEKSEQGLRGHEIIQALLENFPDDLNEEQAVELVRKVARELEVERGARRSDIKIKENPGFKTEATVQLETATLKIVVENINHIGYLTTLPIFLDTVVRFTQDRTSTKYPQADINALCMEEVVDVTFPDITSPTEDEDTEVVIEADEELTITELEPREKPKGAFSLFFDDDEGGDETYVSEGGRGSSSSESSVESEPSLEESKSEPSLSSIQVEEESEPSLSSIQVEEESEPSVDMKVSGVSENNVEVEKDEPEVSGVSENDEETEEEPEEEDNSPDTEESDQVRNIDGMKLNKPYYFQTMIEKKDPVLIVKEDTAEFNAYSRTCLSDKRRQPVVLTDQELAKINKEHPGFLREQDVIKYGSDAKHQYNYICPRYWCLKSNTIVNPEDVKIENGEKVHRPKKGPSCGKVLPKSEKEVKPGYYIYEFNDEGYPGLMPDKHPKGYCLPCCFKNYNTKGRILAKDSCLKPAASASAPAKQRKKEEAPPKDDEYVLGPNKFPLEEGRWGFLQPEIQTMLREVNADCQVSKTNTTIKNDHPCLLRHGIEVSKHQSFVGAMADVLFYGKAVLDDNVKKVARVPSIQDMRYRIAKSLTLDTFVKYQNGNLVTNFQDADRKVNLDKYNGSKLLSKLSLDKEAERTYAQKVVSAFENFQAFLSDDEALIDHTYLWDIFSMPNKYLFKNGVNLVIFQLPNDDITNNVQLLCPTNHYSHEFYQARKPTIFLVKEDGYYEPIYSYLSTGNKLTVTKEFKEYDPQLPKTMRAVLKEIVKPFFELICRPQESMPRVYKATRPLMLHDLVQKLDKYEYVVQKLVMNFSSKVIGVVAKEPGVSSNTGFVPCFPSALDDQLKKDLDFVFMTDLSLWHTYNETVIFLQKLAKRASRRKEKPDIPCKPAFKIIEDELVVGVLTETNQFIQVSEPMREDEVVEEVDLPSITDSDYVVSAKKGNPLVAADVEIATQTKVDQDREDYIRKIKLETSFYNVFRNTVRILLNKYEHIKVREQIEAEINNQFILYTDKLDNVNRLLQKLVGDKIQFIGDENYYKMVNNVSTCIVKDKAKCTKETNLCVVTENGQCNLILPEKNLITQKENEPIYFGRMADELVRYNRIQSFMLQPQSYLSFGQIGYNLRENEIILVQSSLTQEYFEGLVPAVTNKYTKLNNFDDTQPILTQPYENRVSLEKETDKVAAPGLACETTEHDHIKSGLWKKCFPSGFKELEYSKNATCTFDFVIALLERKTGTRFSIQDIKSQLLDEYKRFLPDKQTTLVQILSTEGKKTLGDQVLAETISFVNFIYTDTYFLTVFDVWLLVTKHRIPTIFISQKCIMETGYQKQVFVGHGAKHDAFAFIIVPAQRAESVPNFRVVLSDKGDWFHLLATLEPDCKPSLEEAIGAQITVDDFVNRLFDPIKKKTAQEKQACLRDGENTPEKPKKRKKLVLVDSTPSSAAPENFIVQPKRKTKRKIAVKGTKKRKHWVVASSEV